MMNVSIELSADKNLSKRIAHKWTHKAATILYWIAPDCAMTWRNLAQSGAIMGLAQSGAIQRNNVLTIYLRNYASRFDRYLSTLSTIDILMIRKLFIGATNLWKK